MTNKQKEDLQFLGKFELVYFFVSVLSGIVFSDDTFGLVLVNSLKYTIYSALILFILVSALYGIKYNEYPEPEEIEEDEQLNEEDKEIEL